MQRAWLLHIVSLQQITPFYFMVLGVQMMFADVLGNDNDDG